MLNPFHLYIAHLTKRMLNNCAIIEHLLNTTMLNTFHHYIEHLRIYCAIIEHLLNTTMLNTFHHYIGHLLFYCAIIAHLPNTSRAPTAQGDCRHRRRGYSWAPAQPDG